MWVPVPGSGSSQTPSHQTSLLTIRDTTAVANKASFPDYQEEHRQDSEMATVSPSTRLLLLALRLRWERSVVELRERPPTEQRQCLPSGALRVQGFTAMPQECLA